jgi:hypothetical protein
MKKNMMKKNKETGDSTTVHPQLKFNTFLGDSAFDSYDNGNSHTYYNNMPKLAIRKLFAV